MSRRAHCEDRAFRLADHFFGDAPQQHVGKRAPTVRSHDDQVDALSGAYSYLATNDEIPCVSPIDIPRQNPWRAGSDWRYLAFG